MVNLTLVALFANVRTNGLFQKKCVENRNRYLHAKLGVVESDAFPRGSDTLGMPR